jgi:Fe-S cluster assembly protein SufB
MSNKNSLYKNKTLKPFLANSYKAGFDSNIDQDIFRKGLDAQTVEYISSKKKEPKWLLEWRLKSLKHWQQIKEPTWSDLNYQKINYQKISYYAEPRQKPRLNSLSEIDPEIKKTFDKLGISLEEQKILSNVAVDAILDSVSIFTTFKDKLKQQGIIFCSISEAVGSYPELVKKYLGSVVPYQDNFFACLNSAVFSDGSFVYIPKNTRCSMDLSSYFRINSQETGQFERTLIIAEEGSFVSYLEGCTAPMRTQNQLHAAVVEIVCLGNAEVKYSTVQNWYPGSSQGKGGVYNFVTKRARCKGKGSKVSWTQLETGSAITWKYPSCILEGEGSIGEFYSVAVTKNYQQADTGTKMIHIGKNSRSKILSKSIVAGHSLNNYRGLVKILPGADNCINYTNCETLIVSSKAVSNTYPCVDSQNPASKIQHEASTSKISEKVLFYLAQRGLDLETSSTLVVKGFVKDIVKKLPLEFAMEAQKLLEITLEGSIG